jgi:hypothetical protein
MFRFACNGGLEGMCKCRDWCRDWRERQGGKYPASNHAPGCDEYRLEEFARVEHDGAACTMEPAEAAAMVAESDCKYTVTPVFLTRDQFERMGEFHGF